ncbi:outer membrane lipoprotein chaperone LolA [Longimicrobium sp.]|uniref:outer membrane lipoprotein chaperone LolA n=1 Tax=Longimicrobium sp. TaxID=2029185 RepID=UPI002EDB5C41
MIKRSAVAALLVLAACGGQESSADSPAEGVTPQRAPAAEAPVVAEPVTQVAGGDTSSAPAAPIANAPAAPAAPAEAPKTEAAPKAEASLDDATEILRRTERRADAIRSLEADFVQSLRVPLLNQTQNSAGKMYQRKPDRFLMRFTQPAGDIMVADGRYFWLYYPSTDRTQVIRTSIARGGGSVDLQRQFIGDAAKRFVATLNRSETVDGHDSYALTLVPRQASPYKVLRIWVDKADYTVRRFETTEENESVRRVELRNIRVNGTLPDNLFSFTPPQGTQVFDQ